ncbi:MAG TPA: AAA family ATPase [Albitalea sp.]|nr:AAA family ATPase [Albitalea sp.]
MKIRIVTAQPDNAQAWAQALRAGDPGAELSTELRAPQDLSQMLDGSRPDVLIAEATTPADFEAVERLAASHPEIDCLLVAAEPTPEMLLRAMRSGVREVLPSPVDATGLPATLARLARRRLADRGGSAHAEMIGFVSCKGGSGATFVAANLAHVLAAGGQRRVALIDMNLQFGDAALFVTSQRPASNVADVARNIQRLDRELLQSAMLQVEPGLWVLASPDDPGQASDVTPEHVHAILELARSMFDYVVIDAGRSISAVTLRALDAAQRLYVVLQLTLPFIRDGRRLHDLFRSLDYPPSKVHWIVNRFEKGGDISLEDLKKTLGAKELITLPNQYEVVAASVNQGVPVERLAPSSAISRALRELAETIAPLPEKTRSGHWLSSFFGRAEHEQGVTQ